MTAVLAPAPRAASSASRVARVPPSCEMPMQRPPFAGVNGCVERLASLHACVGECVGDQLGDRHRPMLGRPTAGDHDRGALCSGLPDRGRDIGGLRPGPVQDPGGQIPFLEDHLLHHPRRPVAQLGIVVGQPAAIIGHGCQPTGRGTAAVTDTRQDGPKSDERDHRHPQPEDAQPGPGRARGRRAGRRVRRHRHQPDLHDRRRSSTRAIRTRSPCRPRVSTASSRSSSGR